MYLEPKASFRLLRCIGATCDASWTNEACYSVLDIGKQVQAPPAIQTGQTLRSLTTQKDISIKSQHGGNLQSQAVGLVTAAGPTVTLLTQLSSKKQLAVLPLSRQSETNYYFWANQWMGSLALRLYFCRTCQSGNFLSNWTLVSSAVFCWVR